MASSSQQFQVGDRIPGTVYLVEDVVGSGGMGSVYRVEHTELGRRFVLKALHGHLSSRDDLVARLRNEWRALAKLDHPNIVQVTDAGRTADGLPYYVMESLKGSTLSRLLSQEGRLGVQRSAIIIQDVLAGLHAAHQTGAIHRDIKPPNIFVETEGSTKLLDFGIAKLRDQAAKVVTAGGVSIGTPRYMAPEQAQGTDVDARADIYATALVLYEMIVGKGPFAQIRDPNELVMAHIGQEPERVDLVQPSVPEELGDLLQRWLSKDPDSRPATADIARRELAALAQALPADAGDDAEDVTLAGAYDESTLGAESASTRTLRAQVPEREEDNAERAQVGEAASTKTWDDGPNRGERISDPVGPAGTLGWGTSDAELEASSATLHDGEPKAERDAGHKKRRSVTPPPISSLPSGRKSQAPGTTSHVKWVVATAVISFVVALGISRLVTQVPGKEQAESSAEELDGTASSSRQQPLLEGPDNLESTPTPEPPTPASSASASAATQARTEPNSDSEEGADVAATELPPERNPKASRAPGPTSAAQPKIAPQSKKLQKKPFRAAGSGNGGLLAGSRLG